MSTESVRERLRGPQEQALERYARGRAEHAERRDQPPRLGEIFAFPETAARGILWAVTDQDPEDAQRFLVVAADVEPLVGSADLAVAADGARGPWTLRCRFALWLRAADFSGAKRAALLEPDVVERVRRMRAEIAAGEPTGSVWEQETDAEPEYQDWMGELEAARAALAGRESPEASQTAGKVVPFRSPVRTGSWNRFYGLAASILLVVSLTLAGGMGWQHKEVSRLEGEKESLEKAHREDLDKQAAENRRQLELREGEIETLRQQLAAAGRAEPEINLPFRLLTARDTRGQGKPLVIPPTAPSFVLLFQPEDEEDYPRYEVKIWEKETDNLIWSTDELTIVEEVHLSFSVRCRMFPAGAYRIELFGLRDGEREKLVEYTLHVKRSR